VKEPQIEIVNNPGIDAQDADYVVCLRVADLPIPYRRAEIRECSICHERVWLGHSSPRKPPIICHPCWDVATANADQIKVMLTPELARKLVNRS
jgi:hypothetical protein